MSVRALGPMLTEWPLKRLAAQIVSDYTGLYSDEIDRQLRALGYPLPGEGKVQRIKDVLVRETVVRRPEEQQALILLSVPGTVSVKHRSGEGVYSATWRLEVHSYVATDEGFGGELAAILSLAATRALLAGLPGRLDGLIGAVSWQGKGDQELAPRGDRLRHSSTHLLDVVLNDVIADGGPLPDLPPDDELTDPGDLPTIEDTDATAEPVEEIDA